MFIYDKFFKVKETWLWFLWLARSGSSGLTTWFAAMTLITIVGSKCPSLKVNPAAIYTVCKISSVFSFLFKPHHEGTFCNYHFTSVSSPCFYISALVQVSPWKEKRANKFTHSAPFTRWSCFSIKANPHLSPLISGLWTDLTFLDGNSSLHCGDDWRKQLF